MTASAGTDRVEEPPVPALARMHRVSLCLARNSADALDLVQAASLRALRGVGTFETGSQFDARMCRIVASEHCSRRRQARRRAVELAFPEAPERRLPGEGAGPRWQRPSWDPAGELVGRMDAARRLARDHGIGAPPVRSRPDISVRRRASRGPSRPVDRSGSPAPRSSPPG